MKKNILNLLIMLTIISIIIPSTIYAVDLTRDTVKKTVSDSSTNLMWQDDAINSLLKSWSVQITYCEALTLGGYDDWRLPNRFELMSLIDYTKSNPAIKENVFKFITSTDYWSATSSAKDSSYAWYVDFDSGSTSSKTKSSNDFYRCVRDK